MDTQGSVCTCLDANTAIRQTPNVIVLASKQGKGVVKIGNKKCGDPTPPSLGGFK